MFYQIPQLTLNQVNPRHLTKVHLPWGYQFSLSLSFTKWQVHQNHSFASKAKHSRQWKKQKENVTFIDNLGKWKWYKTLSYTIRLSVTIKTLSYTIRLSVTIKTLSYTIRSSVAIKEYKEVPLSLRGRTHSLKPHLIPGVQLEPIAPWQWRKSRKRPSWLKLRAMAFLRTGGSRKSCNPSFHHHPFPQHPKNIDCPWCHFWSRERKRIPPPPQPPEPHRRHAYPDHLLPSDMISAEDLKRP